DGAKRDRRAYRTQGVFGADQQSRRRLAADPLESGDDFNDDRLPLLERLAQQSFLLVERIEPGLRRNDPGLDIAHAGCGLDQLGIELAAILTERLDFAAQFGLRFCGIALPRQGCVQFLIALLEDVRWVRRRCGRWRL